MHKAHEEKDHAKWLERKKENQAIRNKDIKSNGNSDKTKNANGSRGRKLTLSDAMKSVMTTKTNVSGAEFRQMLDEAKSLMEDFQ